MYVKLNLEVIFVTLTFSDNSLFLRNVCIVHEGTPFNKRYGSKNIPVFLSSFTLPIFTIKRQGARSNYIFL